MSTDHRKPLVAFVLLALAAAVLVGMGRADADAGRLFEAGGGRTVHVHGVVPAPPALSDGRVAHVRDGKGARRTASVSRGAARRPFGSSRKRAQAPDRGDARGHAHGRSSGKRSDAADLAGRKSHEAKGTSGARAAHQGEWAFRKAEKSQAKAKRALDKHQGSPRAAFSWSSGAR